jgi:hypothetical protein
MDRCWLQGITGDALHAVLPNETRIIHISTFLEEKIETRLPRVVIAHIRFNVKQPIFIGVIVLSDEADNLPGHDS